MVQIRTEDRLVSNNKTDKKNKLFVILAGFFMVNAFIAEFIGLKSKLYSIQLYSGNAFKVEDEMTGTEIEEFIGIKPMVYSIPQPSGKMLSKIFKFRKKSNYYSFMKFI